MFFSIYNISFNGCFSGIFVCGIDIMRVERYIICFFDVIICMNYIR